MKSIAIVGGGQAAAVAARTLRRRGFDGSLVVLGDEPERPYQRPPLSKEYLVSADEDGLYLLPEQWCAAQDVQLRLSARVASVRPGTVQLADGTDLPADAVLIATGGRPRVLSGVPAGERVHYLRTRADADRLRAALAPGAHVIVIGAGFIGSEVASTARARGADVTVVEALDAPLQRVLGAELGAVCASLHRDNGVALRCGETVESVTAGADGVRVTTSGAVLDGNAVVVGIGIEPNVEVAAASGIRCDNGILVDEACRTSMPDVYAAGDVANHAHPLFGERIRVEHFDNASKMAAAAANAMLGRGGAYADPHWFWSDQYDVNLQYAGHARTWDELVVRGSLPDLDFCAFYLRNGLIRAAFAADRGGDVLAAKELIGAGIRVDPATLRDEDVDLVELTMEPA